MKGNGMQKWIVTRGPAKPEGWHYQARTADQLCSFAIVALDGQHSYMKTKAADGKTDVFTLTAGTGQATMNVIGKIKYEGKWK